VPAIVAFLLVAGVMAGCAPRAAAPAALPPAEHVAVGVLDGRTGAYLNVRDAASRVRLVLAVLPGLLYRISTPAGSGLEPRVTARNGRVQATLLPTGDDGPDEVRIVLNRDVRWDLRLPAGAGEHELDLRRGRVSRVDVGSSGLVEMRLAAPSGTVPVTFAEVGSAVLGAEPGTPLRVIPERSAVPAGATLTVSGWPGTVDRYAIRARGGIGALTVR
jgi:hypothetical protein